MTSTPPWPSTAPALPAASLATLLDQQARHWPQATALRWCEAGNGAPWANLSYAALADRAGTTMHDIVASIQRVSDIVGEISSASAEQSAGVAQVGEAITQMDQATQQNAALVEEMAAAASSLRTQAHQMVEAVAVFRLRETGSRIA